MSRLRREADKIERFEIIDNSHAWLDCRNLRNTLTHEYPDNKEDIIAGIKQALDEFIVIKKIFEVIVLRVQALRP